MTHIVAASSTASLMTSASALALAVAWAAWRCRSAYPTGSTRWFRRRATGSQASRKASATAATTVTQQRERAVVGGPVGVSGVLGALHHEGPWKR